MTVPSSHTAGRRLTHGTGRSIAYQPALDGMRALAVAAVLAYHAGFGWARGGFLGVDAFFVLSGFLITSLLLAEWRESGGIGLVAFWARRARRLLPALFLMLIGVALYAVVLAGPLELGKIRGDALATIGYVANWRPIFAGQSYFDQYAVPSPLRHTWSLGIEEQYYIVWPLLVLASLRLRRGSIKLLLPVSLALLVVSALLMGLLFDPGRDPSRVYYGTDTRAQSLLVGAVLAMLLRRLGPVRHAVAGHLLQAGGLACAGGIAFFWSVTGENSALLYRGGFLLLALGVAVIIAAAVQPKAGPLARALSLPPLRGLGLISYGVYLWHWPIYMMLTADRTGLRGYALFGLRVLATLAVAIVSYRLVEMPLRRGAFRRWKASWAFAPSAAAALVVTLLFVTRGAASPTAAYPVDYAMPEVNRIASLIPTRVLMIGDSVALSMAPGLDAVAPQYNIAVWHRDYVGCGFLDVDREYGYDARLSTEQEEKCRKWKQTWSANVAAFQPDVVVMVFGAMDSLDRQVDGTLLKAGTPEWEAFVSSGLEKQMKAFNSQGAKLALLTFPCSRPASWASRPDAAKFEEDTFRRINDLNAVYRRFAEEHPDDVALVDLNRFACPDGRFTDLVLDGVRMREDGLHFTPQGSVVVARWLAPQLVAIARAAHHDSQVSAAGGQNDTAIGRIGP